MAPQPETANPAAPQEAAKAPASSAPPAAMRSAPDGTITKPKLGAISPPLPWPSPKIQEIARSARPRFSAVPPEAKTPRSISDPVRNLLPTAAPAAGDNPGESVSRPAFLARLGTQRERAAKVLRRGRRHAFRALLRTQAAAGKLSARIENARQLSKLRRQIQDIERMAAEQRGAPQVDEARPAEMQPSRGARARALSLFASMRGPARRAIDYTRLTWGRTLASTRDGMNNAGDAARVLRVRIKFRPFESTRLPSWLARGTGAKLLHFRRDSRLWTSMAMAALSAVLALLVVSGVRGYAPEAPPSKVSRKLPSTPVAQAAIVSKPSPATPPVSAEPARTAVKRASLSKPVRAASSPKVTRKKTHHHQEDDYVAKDTYVYYGPNGRTTR